VRVISGGSATRSEYRIGPADANPYLALTAALASGLWGIQNQVEPPPAITGSAYESPGAAKPLPGTLGEAARMFAASSVARELFGVPFVEHFAATRDWEDRQARKAVTDWDLARYFEVI
jgi:glutamine synthetase